MKIYRFGDENKPAILLLPDMAKTFGDTFGGILPYFENVYHVIGVEYTGFGEDDGVFASITDEAEKIEKYISDNFDGHIHAIYASAFGGSIATLLAQRGNITFDSAVLGSPRLDKSISLIAKTRAKLGSEKLFRQVGDKYPFLKRESIYNQIFSDLTTDFDKKILPKKGKIHIVYSVKMGEIYNQKYEKTFADANIMMFDYDSEELLYKYPKQLALVVRKCTKNLK